MPVIPAKSTFLGTGVPVQPQQSVGIGALLGGMSALGGYLTRKEEKKIRTEEDKAKNLRAMLPALAQMRMLQPGGDINMPGVGGFNVISPQTDPADEALNSWRAMQTRAKGMEIGDIPTTTKFERDQASEAVIKANPTLLMRPELLKKAVDTLMLIRSGKMDIEDPNAQRNLKEAGVDKWFNDTVNFFKERFGGKKQQPSYESLWNNK